MLQRCPNCGEWCYAEVKSFKDKALDVGRKIGFALAKETVKGLMDGLSGSDCHFVCQSCGYEWEANEEEDQSDELNSETSELIEEISSLVSSIESEEDYEEAAERCKTLASFDTCEALYWLAKAQYNLANIYDGLLSSTEARTDEKKYNEYHEKRQEWFHSAYKTINNSIHFYIEDIEFYQAKDNLHALAWAFNLKAWIENSLFGGIDGITAARSSFIDAMDTDFDDVLDDALEGYDSCTERLLHTFNHYATVREDVAELLNGEDAEMRDVAKELIASAEESRFTNLPYAKRQFVFITKSGANSIAGCTDSEDNIRYVFTIDAIPSELTFPVGHPQQNTLYVANPARKGQYIPYKGAEDSLFHDKVNDFIRLSQCLGATEISFHSIRGESVSQSFLSSTSVNGSMNAKIYSVTGEYSGKSNGDSSYNSSKEIELTRRYDPISKPYCPDDVEWLSLDPEWQKFVKQRLEGNILESSIKISSSESICSNTSTLKNVKTAFDNMMVKVDANYDSEEDNTFSSSESTEWQIYVKFRSIRDFMEQCDSQPERHSSLKLSLAEEKYKEGVMFVLEDGVIGDVERRLLDRKRQKFGVSEDRAKLIEESCKPSLSDEEKEYIEIYRDMLEDGEISERRRKMLKREAETLGIADSRAFELESLI